MDINSIISEMLRAKEEEAAAKKRADTMKKLLLAHVGDAELYQTDVYTVFVKTTASTRLDTAALYADFPDIKETYGKTTVSKTVSAVVTADAGKQPA